MDEQTRKALTDAYANLMRSSKIIKALLDGDKPQRVTPAELRNADVAGAATWAKPQATITPD